MSAANLLNQPSKQHSKQAVCHRICRQMKEYKNKGTDFEVRVITPFLDKLRKQLTAAVGHFDLCKSSATYLPWVLARTRTRDPHLRMLHKLQRAGTSSYKKITFSFSDLTGSLYFLTAFPAYSCNTTAFGSSTTASGSSPNL